MMGCLGAAVNHVNSQMIVHVTCPGYQGIDVP